MESLDLDLRLLSVFSEIYRTRSVSAAAEALDLGQPAVSVALGKLRRHFTDPLFVRSSGVMVPTPFSDGLIGHVRGALEALQGVLAYNDSFDPTTSTRTFRIAMTDISQLVLLPRLWETLHTEAPGIRIVVLPLQGETSRMLEEGEADLALGYMPQLDYGFYQQLLFRQNFVCIASRQHPRIGKQLTMRHFETENHAVVAVAGSSPAIIEHEIARLGIKRRIVLELPSFIGAAFVAENTDLLITIPERLGELLAEHGNFRMFPVPFSIPEYSVKQHWHERYHRDPGNRWLRGLIARLLSETRLPAESSGSNEGS